MDRPECHGRAAADGAFADLGLSPPLKHRAAPDPVADRVAKGHIFFNRLPTAGSARQSVTSALRIGRQRLKPRHSDGSAGDANYGIIGTGYARYRRPDPRIAAYIINALGNARTILNIGAGPGSYEPSGRAVTAAEP